jgi:hypothetical protein
MHVALAAPRTFTISGTITDGFFGGVLPNVTVQVTDSANGSRSTTTASNGGYSFTAIPGGANDGRRIGLRLPNHQQEHVTIG